MHYVLDDVSAFDQINSKGYTLTIDGQLFSLFVVRHLDKFFAYKNHCPHTGVNLNWQEHQFLDITEQRIQCTTHGALFRIDDGICEWGPCLGQSLKPLDIDIQDEKIVLTHNAS